MTTPPNENEPVDSQTAFADMLWRAYLTGDYSQLDAKVKMLRQVFARLPSPPRCRVCNAPFHGMGGMVVGLFGFGAGRSKFNPNLCDRCEKIVKAYQVGLELPLTLLFADVRGSTNLAEEIGASAFHRLINRFYQASTTVMVENDALIDKLVGDEVIGLFVPGIAGPQYTRRAWPAARGLWEARGTPPPGGPWCLGGGGVHAVMAYVGAVGSSDSMSDITVLGDAANTTARLASQAGPGEILVSEAACHMANLDLKDCETRTLNLKGRTEPVAVRVIRVTAG